MLVARRLISGVVSAENQVFNGVLEVIGIVAMVVFIVAALVVWRRKKQQ